AVGGVTVATLVAGFFSPVIAITTTTATTASAAPPTAMYSVLRLLVAAVLRASTPEPNDIDELTAPTDVPEPIESNMRSFATRARPGAEVSRGTAVGIASAAAIGSSVSGNAGAG